MSLHPTPVSPASLGSLASFEMETVNDDDAAHSDNTVAVALQLVVPGVASSSYTAGSLNDVDPIVDNSFDVALRTEATLALMHVTEHNDVSNQYPLIGTKLSEPDDKENDVENHPFNITLFHDNPQKKGKENSHCITFFVKKDTFDIKV